MAAVAPLAAGEVGFMEAYLPQDSAIMARRGSRTAAIQPSFLAQEDKHFLRDESLPFVTLTYASSLDGMIAVAPGARTTLSGDETKSMTHYLRMRHDAILVGAGTAEVDDPGLNCRYPGATIDDQPRPIIVDPNGRYKPEGKKAYALHQQGVGKAPWIVAHVDSADPFSNAQCQIDEHHLIERKPESVNSLPKSKIPWRSILETLKKKGINSVMIEGGANVINSLITQPTLVDRVIITMAPTFLGQGGVAVAPRKAPSNKTENAAWIDYSSWRQFGNDVVLFGNPRRPPVYQ